MVFSLLSIQKDVKELAMGMVSVEILSHIGSVKTKVICSHFPCFFPGFIAFMHSTCA